MSDFRGDLETWNKIGGQLRSTITNQECPTPGCDQRVWREERLISTDSESRYLSALICHACKKLYVEERRLVEP